MTKILANVALVQAIYYGIPNSLREYKELAEESRIGLPTKTV